MVLALFSIGCLGQDIELAPERFYPMLARG